MNELRGRTGAGSRGLDVGRPPAEFGRRPAVPGSRAPGVPGPPGAGAHRAARARRGMADGTGLGRVRTARSPGLGGTKASTGPDHAAPAALERIASPGGVVAVGPGASSLDLPVPPAWGWKRPGAGRAAHVAAPPEYQATTSQVCGLFPFLAGGAAPVVGNPVGRSQLGGEVVCLDPLAWLRAGLVTNPGVFVLGQPGTGKSTLVKRLITGAVATGVTALILGDTKPDYTQLARHLGGQVIRIGRGLDRINPLDSGPLGQAQRGMTGEAAQALRWEVRGRRLSLLMALCALVRDARLSNAEELILGRAIDLLDERLPGKREPTPPDVLAVIEQGPDVLRSAARAGTDDRYRELVSGLVFTLDLLCTGSLAGVFDGPTSQPIDPGARIVSVDISRVGAAGDKLLTAAMLCTWAYGYAMADASAAASGAVDGDWRGDGRPDETDPDRGTGCAAGARSLARRPYLAVMDELWRALRGAPGLVDHADSLTRLNRAKGMASIMITHSLADLDALAREEDRAKARGFIDRSAITVLAGLPPRELARVAEVVPLTGPEQELVASWSAPDSWRAGARHPGRGKYLIKTGERLGIPVELALAGAERELYETDPQFGSESGLPAGCGGARW